MKVDISLMKGFRKNGWIIGAGILIMLKGMTSAVLAMQSPADNMRAAAEQFLNRVTPLYSHDLIHDLRRLEASLTEDVTMDNLEKVFLLTEYHYSVEDKEEMLAYAARLERLSRALKRPEFAGLVEVYRAYALALDDDYDGAIRRLEEILPDALDQEDTMLAVSTYDALASLSPIKGEYYIALDYADKAARLLQSASYEKRLRLHLYNTIAYVYTELEDLEKILEFANLSLDIAEESGLYFDISTVVYNLSLGLQDEKHYELSSLYLMNILDFYQETGQRDMVLYPYYGLALNAYEQNQTELSLDYTEKALVHRAISEDFTASLWQLAAEQYAMVGQVDKARDYRAKVEAYFAANPSYEGGRWANLNQRIDAEIAFAEGRYKEAYKILDRFHRKDTYESEKSFSSDVLKLRAGLAATMRIEKAEQTIQLERGVFKLQQMMYLAGAFFIILIIVLSAFVVQRRTVLELNKSKREAESANKTKTEFLANMSHELRTPLNAIIGFSEMMTESVYGPLGHKNYNQYADMINSSGQHLLKIISEILDMSKVESGALELHELECDLLEFVKAAIRIFAGQQNDRNISFSYHAPDDLPYLLADLRILNQILYNALSNAVKFNHQDGHIDISLSQLPENGALRITISDDGIGMTAEEITHVLKPFAQVQNSLTRSHEGTGLGLPLINAFMILHGGTLDIQSEKGVGTTLTMTFPPERTLSADLVPSQSAG